MTILIDMSSEKGNRTVPGYEGKIENKPNRLIHEKSPYLLQHASNPVDWYPWGDEAFRKAKRQDRYTDSVLVRIRY